MKKKTNLMFTLLAFVFTAMSLLPQKAWAGGQVVMLWEGGSVNVENNASYLAWVAEHPYSTATAETALISYSAYHAGLVGLMTGCAAQGATVCICSSQSGYPALGNLNIIPSCG